MKGRKNEAYLKFIRTKTCVSCDKDAVAHHCRDKDIVPYELRGGTSLKPYDLMSYPLCFECHHKVHNGSLKIRDEHYIIISLMAEYISSLESR